MRAEYSSEYVRFQINKVTSWIDGSFIYSSSEAWTNTMRSFKNGTFLKEPKKQFPVRNTMRAPLFNQAVPNVMRMLNPERLYREQNNNNHSIKLYHKNEISYLVIFKNRDFILFISSIIVYNDITIAIISRRANLD